MHAACAAQRTSSNAWGGQQSPRTRVSGRPCGTERDCHTGRHQPHCMLHSKCQRLQHDNLHMFHSVSWEFGMASQVVRA